MTLADKTLNILLNLKMKLVSKFLWKPLIAKTMNPQETQENLLLEIIKRNKNTKFGKDNKFNKIHSYKTFCMNVSVQNYEDLRSYIEAEEIINKPVIYAQTSGTTGKPKYVPIYKETISQYRNSQHIFACALYKNIPRIYSGKVLAIVSPAIEGQLDSGVPYGSMSGLIYQSMPLIVNLKYVLPPSIFEIQDYDEKYYQITLNAVAEKNITLIATANPSTLIKMVGIIKDNKEKLIQDIRKINIARANEISKMDSSTFAALWPNLQCVTTWTGGSCATLLPSLKEQLPDNCPITEMGYLSSEFRGSITIDIENNLGIPTLHENFFEFVEKDNWENNSPDFLTIDQIKKGKQYHVFATTKNGLYRYFINDIIEVTGMYNNTPTIKFVQKGKGVTNITGEKLYESQLLQAIAILKKNHSLDIKFFMMLADPETQKYSLFLEHEPVDINISEILSELNIEFDTKTKSGRLKPLAVHFIKKGTSESYKKHCLNEGQRESQFKTIHLQYKDDCTFNFEKHLRTVHENK